VLAACLAGFALARSAGARFARGRSSDRRPGFLVLIGVAGAVPVAMFGLRVLELTRAWEAAPVILMAVMALVVPALVAVAVPRQFAAALLAGWTAGAGAAAVYWFTAATLELNKNGYDAGRIPIAVFGATLLALAVVAVQLGRAAPASADGRDAAA
jgi:hypothetical protein